MSRSLLKALPALGAILCAAPGMAQELPAAAPEYAAPDYKTWDSYLGGADSSQYSSLDQINRENVSRLEVAWTYDAGVGVQPIFNPIVVDGVMYVVAHGNAIVALDAATGAEIWRHRHEGSIGGRGINYWRSADGSDARLVYLNEGMLTQLDARTGERITSFGDNGAVDLRVGLEDGVPGGDISGLRVMQHANPGRIFENLFIIALPAGDFAYESAPGDVHAYDILTGALVWEFHTIPRPGEPGRETWPDNDALYGGGHSWSEATVDVERGIVYIPTGTARYDHYGANRLGDNLYANSVVALDARTGERLWHFQTVHHDLWDYDLPTSPRLLTVRRDGREIPALAQATKQGFLFVLDRETGEPLFPVEERPFPASDAPGEVASPTQPVPTLPAPYARQSFTEADINPLLSEADKQAVRDLLRASRNEGVFTPPSLQGTISIPGTRGGSTWGSVAADPDNGLAYVVSSDMASVITLEPPAEGDEEPAPGAAADFVSYRSPSQQFMIQSNGMIPIAPPWSTITAYDLNTGATLWRVGNGGLLQEREPDYPDAGVVATRGGPVVTAGGLLFIPTSTDRKLRARDVADGSVLWEADLPSGSEGVPAVYEAGGREFVVIPVGSTGPATGGLDLPRGPNQYVAFALPE